MKKMNPDKMMLDNLSFLERFGVKGVTMGSTTYRKKGKSTLEITTKKRVKK